MKKRILAKLRSQAGESIAETLVALLISALALMMLAGAVSAAANVVTKSKDAMAEYYAAESLIVTRETGTNVTRNPIEVKVGGSSFSCNSYQNKRFTNTPVITYKKEG